MYPYDVFLGMDLYEIAIVLGFFAALVYFRLWADRRKFSAKLQNLCIIGAMLAIFGGYGAAVLAQAFYNYLDGEPFRLSSGTGATFYGGLVGGALIFIDVYFIGGRVLRERTAKQSFFAIAGIAGGAIALAHGIGRLGCLAAGCCHGKVTDAWYGIYNVSLGAKTVPVQLFEALFLFALAAFLSWWLWKGMRGGLGVYLSAYAVWRFFAEYLRTDHRGQSPIAFLSPSQLTAVILLLVGVGLIVLEYTVVAELERRRSDDEA